jgi:hypothetical protein
VTQPEKDRAAWPELPYSLWWETSATLHLWTQIVGKIRLSQTPWLNHSWHVTLYPGEQIPWDGDLGHLERDIAPMAEISFLPLSVLVEISICW